jgi:hypothetical protein
MATPDKTEQAGRGRAPRIVSHSELSTARRCAFKHQIFYIERWSKQQDPMSALGKGTAWHLVMETHYNVLLAAQRREITDETRILAASRRKVSAVINDMPDELAELIWWMYEGYVSLYGADHGWTIMGVEHPAEIRLPTPRGGRSGFILKMKIDLIVRDRATKRIRIVDHKSGKDLPHGKALDLDDQFPLYQWGMQQLGFDVFGLTYNAARTYRLVSDIREPGTQALDERFYRHAMYRTPKELHTIALEAYQTARTRYRQQADVARDGMDAPRTTDTMSCQWQCDAFDACLAGRKGVDWRSLLRAKGLTQNFERH